MEKLNDFICPLCGSEMVLRTGKKTGKEFWGCVNYPDCTGKRGLDGHVFGTDGEYPNSLGAEGRRMFDTCISDLSDGMTFDEAREIAEAWEHDEENDHYRDR